MKTLFSKFRITDFFPPARASLITYADYQIPPGIDVLDYVTSCISFATTLPAERYPGILMERVAAVVCSLVA